jgi:ABC-type sugar transport system ATPase subunit
MAKVVLREIAKKFGEVEILKPLTLEIEDGELLVLLGPSGCGKTTTLRIIAGLETPTSGRLLIDDKDVTDLPPKDRDIAMVFQSYALYPHLSVRENLAFGLKVRGTPKPEIDRRTDEVADMLGLRALLDRRPKQLSGGQRQRVAMGRSIVRRPRVFLFDEPLSNLDAALRTQMRAEIARLHARLKATMVYVTHDQVEAMTLASRVVILNEGVVQQIGRPLDVYTRPENGFVGRFLGSPAMNQLAGMIRPGPSFEGPGFSLPLAALVSVEVGRPIVLGFRPQAMRLREGGPIQGEVEIVEPTGGESFVRVRLSGSAGDHHVTARLEGPPSLKIGDRAAFEVDPNQLHLFAQKQNGDAGETLA